MNPVISNNSSAGNSTPSLEPESKRKADGDSDALDSAVKKVETVVQPVMGALPPVVDTTSSDFLKALGQLSLKECLVLVAHVMGGAAIKGMIIEYQHLEGAPFVEVAKTLICFLEAKAAKEEEVKSLQSVIESLKQVLEIDGKLKEQNERAFSVWMVERMRKLGPGKRLLLPGGWIGKKTGFGDEVGPGHAMLYELERQSDGRFTIHVINTGAGAEYHPSKIVGFKEKMIPVRIFHNLPELSVLNPEPWRAYFKLVREAPEKNSQDYSASLIYENLLSSLGVQLSEPDFKEGFGECPDAITQQKAGTCAMKSLLAFLRLRMPNVREYKLMKLEFKLALLRSFERCLRLPEQRYHEIGVTAKKGAIYLLKIAIEDFSISLKKAMDKGYLSLDKARKYDQDVTQLLQFWSSSDADTRNKEEGSIADISNCLQNKDRYHFYDRDKIQVAEVTVGTQGVLVPINLQWPTESVQLLPHLERWIKFFGAPNGREVWGEANRILCHIFAQMPSVGKREYWGKIPQEQIEGCITHIVSLSNLLFKSCRYAFNREFLHLNLVCHMLKTLAVVKLLTSGFKELEPLVLNTSFINDDFLEPSKNPYLFFTDPQLEREYSDTLQFFADKNHGSSASPLFNENLPQYLVKGRGNPFLTVFPGDIERLKKHSSEKEVVNGTIGFVYTYLQSHPDVKEKVLKSFANEKMAVLDHSMVAMALTDTTGEYLPKPFCALRKQVLIAQCFCLYPQIRDYAFVDLDKISLSSQSRMKYQEDNQNGLGIVITLLTDSFLKELPYARYASAHPKFTGIDAVYPVTGTHNGTMVSRSDENCKQVALLRSCDDKSQQVVKVIAHFRKQMRLFSDRNELLRFPALVFERNTLGLQLDQYPQFSHTLSQFIKEGLDYANVINNLKNTLFFLRMGDYFAAYCRDRGIVTPNLFPDIYVEIEKLLQRNKLTQHEERAALQDQLASYARRTGYEVSDRDITILLKKMIRFHELEKNEKEVIPQLENEINLLRRETGLALMKQQEKQRNEILTQATGCDSRWEIKNGTAQTVDATGKPDNRVQLDLLTGGLYKEGAAISKLPFKWEEVFAGAYGPAKSLKEIRSSSPTDATFLDRHGRKSRIYYWEKHRYWVLLKTIDGKVCRYCDHQKPAVLKNCVGWESLEKESDEIFFIDNNSGAVSYSYKNKALYSNVDGPTKNLILADDRGRELGSLPQFDYGIGVWIDDSKIARVIEYPKYDLFFTVDWPTKERCRIYAPPPYQDFYLSDQQRIKELHRFSGYLVLENEEGDRKVMLTAQWLESSKWDGFSCHLRSGYSSKELTHYYVYSVDAKGRLSDPNNLEAQLYLSYIYLRSNDYANAHHILSNPALMPPRGYTQRESEILSRLMSRGPDNFSERQEDEDPRAIALYVKTKGLTSSYNSRDSHHHYGRDRKPAEYLSCLAHLPQGIFSSDEERKLLKSSDSAVSKRRLCYLQGTPIEVEKETPSKPLTTASIEILWEPGEFDDISLEINPAVLDTLESGFRQSENWISKWFLSFYRIAKEEPSDSLLRFRLRSQLLLYRTFDYKGHYTYASWSFYRNNFWESGAVRALFTILIHTAHHPEKMPPFSELFAAFTKVLKQEKQNEAEKKAEEEQKRKAEDWSSLVKMLEGMLTEVAKMPSRRIDQGGMRVGAYPSVKKEQFPSERIHYRQSYAFPELFSETLFIRTKGSFDESQNKENAILLEKFAAAENDEKERVEKRAIRELRADVEFALQTPSPHTWAILPDEVPHFEKSLQTYLEEIKARIKTVRRKILSVANKRSLDPGQVFADSFAERGGAKKPLKIDDLLFPYLRQDVAEYRTLNPLLTTQEVHLLHAELEEYLIASTRLEQLKRVQRGLRDWKKVQKKGDPNLLRECTQDIVEAITAQRHYDPADNPELLIFEFKLRILLRPEQVRSFHKLTEGKDLVLQLMMGGGKTDILVPLLAYKKADGNTLSAIMVPKELLPGISERIWIRSGLAFKQNIVNVKFGGLDSLEKLQQIDEVLEEIRSRKQILILTDQDIHALNLRIQEERTLLCNSQKIDPGSECAKRYELLKKIKMLLKTKGNVVIDEAHKIFYCKQDSRIALNVQRDNRVNPQYVKVAVLWYQQLFKSLQNELDLDFCIRFKTHTHSQPFVLSNYSKYKMVLVSETLEALSQVHKDLVCYKNTAEWNVILKYLSAEPGEEVELPPTLGDTLKNLLAFLRSEVLISPSTWNTLANLRYGFFDVEGKPSLLAGPYESALQPKVGSQFANLTEIINYTIQIYFAMGLPENHFRKEILRIRENVHKEMADGAFYHPCEAYSYEEYISLSGEKWAKEFPLFEMSEMEVEALRNHISSNPPLLLNFLEKYILPSIPIYEHSLISDAQQLACSFATAQAFTGTPVEDTLPDRFQLLPDKGTTGKIIALMWKNSRHLVHLLKEEKDLIKILKEMLEGQDKLQFRVLLDAGALFKDLPAAKLAEAILEIRKDLNAVLFFKGNEQMYLIRHPHSIVPCNKVEIPVEQRFTVYDQSHCTGTHIPQLPTAHACITMHKTLSYRDLAQAAARMRGIARGQLVHLFITPSQNELIKQTLHKDITDIMDPILFMCKVEGRQQADDNLVSIKQNMRNEVVQACQNILDPVPAELLNSPKYCELNDILVTKIPDSPYKQYGTVSALMGAKEALLQFCTNALMPFEKWCDKYRNEEHFAVLGNIRGKLNAIISTALRQERERVNRLISAGISQDRDQEIAVAVRTQTATETHAKQREEVNIELNNRFAGMEQSKRVVIKAPRISLNQLFIAASWRPINVEALLKETDNPICIEQLLKIRKESEQPLIRANDLFQLLQPNARCPKLFDPNILLSFDLIATEEAGQPLGVFQKPIGPYLILQSKLNPKFITAVLISGREAESVKEALLNDIKKPCGNRTVRICLAYGGMSSKFSTEVYQQGSDPINLEEMENNESFLSMRLQIKFLSGETTATKREVVQYRTWLCAQPNLKAIESFFKKHLLVFADSLKYYSCSVMSGVFKDKR